MLEFDINCDTYKVLYPRDSGVRYIFNITNKLREVRINTANVIINYTPDKGS